MGRKGEAPKGEEFLPGTSADELFKMGKRAGNGTDAYKYLAMSMRKRCMELDEISAALGIPRETIRRWISDVHREGLAGAPRGKAESRAKI